MAFWLLFRGLAVIVPWWCCCFGDVMTKQEPEREKQNSELEQLSTIVAMRCVQRDRCLDSPVLGHLGRFLDGGDGWVAGVARG